MTSITNQSKCSTYFCSVKNIKFNIALALSLTVLLFTVKSAFWLSYYVVFTDNFIESYCENTDQPELECDGKCFLSDVLDKKETDTPKNANIFLESELLFTTTEYETDLILDALISKQQHSYFYNSLYKFHYLKNSFKPPSVVV
ncbi:hypothetical protein LB452_08400 [Psychroflexus sp. CAK8W]|uniref:Uncharacterized protein n=1 Tax=Psychroflexus longus TaxID=2873596 RepID=A0ABS7XM34_9FLAO|nr:hypothetical protein [Psychroflexus longus]MBZ9778941.1 hypothetical protein [Psychroflexus longus]